MRVLIYFQPRETRDVYEGKRMRKNLKGACELAGVTWVESSLAMPDLVHFISPDDEGKLNEARSNGEKVVVSALYCESDSAARFLDYLPNVDVPMLKPKSLRMLNNADFVFVPGENERRFLVSSGVTSPIDLLPPGVKLSRFEKNDPIESMVFYRYFGVKENERYVFYCGSLDDKRTVDLFAKTAALCPGLRFFYFGNSRWSSNAAALTKRLKKSSPSNVTFSGIVEDDVYRSAIMNADVYLAMLEQFSDPIQISEACAAQTQIIAIGDERVGSILIDKKNCYIYPDPEKAAAAIESYCLGKLKPTIIEGYKSARECALSAIGKKLKAVYAALLCEPLEVTKND